MPTGFNGLFSTMDAKFMNRADLRVAYDFAESGQILNKASNYSGFFSGILNGSNSFYLAPGTGYPTGHTVSIENTGDFYSSDFSHFFVIQKSGNNNNDNFFNSLAESGGNYSGYNISINNAGKLVFGYADCSGPQSISSDFTLPNVANFAVTKRGNFVSLYSYTPIFNVLESSQGVINETHLFQSDYSDLFFAPTAPAGFIKDNYSGFINNYLYFSKGLSPSQVVDVFSGIYSTIIISGATTGNAFNECTGIFNFPIESSITISGSASSQFTLTKQGIVLLRPFPSGSKVLVDYTTGYDNVTWNNTASYDFNKQNFTINPILNSFPIVYLNGQRVISGLSTITGQFCATGRAWERDYAMSGSSEILDANGYVPADTVVYDLPLRHSWQYLYSGTGTSVNLTVGAGSGAAIYRNGLRIDNYSISGTTLTLDTPLVSGDLICADFYQLGYEKLNEVYTTGFFMTSGSFAQNTSRAHLNGQRLLLGTDYLEITSGTLLQSSPLPQIDNLVVDINTYTLWNL